MMILALNNSHLEKLEIRLTTLGNCVLVEGNQLGEGYGAGVAMVVNMITIGSIKMSKGLLSSTNLLIPFITYLRPRKHD